MNIIKKSDIELLIKKYQINSTLTIKYSDFKNNDTIITGYQIINGQYHLLTEPLGMINVERLERGL